MIKLKYRLEASKEQMEIIKISLEEFFRVRMGQFGSLSEDLAFMGYNYDGHDKSEFNTRIERRSSANEVFCAAMDVAQPMRKHGVVPDQSLEMLRAQDIWQVIRNKLYLDNGGDPNGWNVDARDPMSMTGENIPTLERLDEEHV